MYVLVKVVKLVSLVRVVRLVNKNLIFYKYIKKYTNMSIMNRRIMNEIRKKYENVNIQPREANIYVLDVSINTEIRGVKPRLTVNIPNAYPFEPPKITFHTHLTHPNIGPRGQICLDILKDKWLPSFHIIDIALNIIEFLNDESTWNCPKVPDWDNPHHFKKIIHAVLN